MNARKQVLEAELNTVRTILLSPNLDLTRAAMEREKELRAELGEAQRLGPANGENSSRKQKAD